MGKKRGRTFLNGELEGLIDKEDGVHKDNPRKKKKKKSKAKTEKTSSEMNQKELSEWKQNFVKDFKKQGHK